MSELSDYKRLVEGPDRKRLENSRDYWRNAYEELVKQTGRDLNDGFGIDPRKTARFAEQPGIKRPSA